MSDTDPAPSFVPILGTEANDTLSVDTSVSFTWVPDPGNAFTGSSLYFDDQVTFTFQNIVEMGPSTASGLVTFDVPSSQPFDAAPASNFKFSFTKYGGADLNTLQMGENLWGWNPATGTLNPFDSGAAWDDVIIVDFEVDKATFYASHLPEGYSAQDVGHWALVPNPIDTDVFGGAGNDTIYGGQGREVLSGDTGDDVIYVGYGDDLALGGAGNDVLHGGVGLQVLDGGAGSDTIWGGTGAQTIMGDNGNDLIMGGTGPETVTGGNGRDTIWGGSGTAYLDGGTGADILHAGTGNETLVGGAGHDTFELGHGASGRDVITDFHLGEDVLKVATGFDGLAIARPQDLAAHITAGSGGAAVLTLGDMSITLLGLSVSQVTSHLQQVFKIN